ncbi:MAG: hypothetical protein J5472_08560 [Clostridia bacterium]|nr:hypothetical protein [Clostridia bacterium]
MKRMLTLLLALSLLLPCIGALSEGGRLEGEGFASPEDAVTAYLDAMNRGDVGEMLSTFALETFAEHVIPEMYNRRLGMFSMQSFSGVPITDEYSRSLAANARYGMLAESLMQQYIEAGAALQGMTIAPLGTEEMQRIRNGFAASPMRETAGRVEFVKWVSPVALTGGRIAMPMNRLNSATQRAYAGADDLMEMAAHIRVNGVDGLLLMGCAKYGDRWYNLEFGGLTGSIMGLNRYEQILKLLTTTEDMQLALAMAANTFPDVTARWEACRESGLPGTKWALTEMNVPGVTVRADADAALGDAGQSVWAELKLYGTCGGLVTIRVSPALQEALQMPYDSSCVGIAWQAADGKMETDMIRAMVKNDIQLNFEECTGSLEPGADRIVFRFADGTEAVFAKQ